MANIPIVLYVLLFVVTLFAPLRWGIVGYLLLSNIDLGSLNASIGVLNAIKAMVLPVFLLWRLRAYAGHGKVISAPIAWGLLIFYAAIASTWSLFPSYAIKLIGHMIGSLVICMVLLRASKGGYLNQRTVLPVALGTLAIAAIHWRFLHNWGGEPERFTTFAGAQSFAALITALYCAVLSFKKIQWPLRLTLCTVLAASVIVNGSRIWIIGLCLSTFAALLVSKVQSWMKLVTAGAALVAVAVLLSEAGPLMELIDHSASSNRIAAALSAAYAGNSKSTGLGTFNLRHELFRRTVAAIEGGSTAEFLFGHGTCNGAIITATLSKNPDPNRALHDEWLRAIYEWGFTGLALWIWFIASLFFYAIKGAQRHDHSGYAKSLLIYLPAFALGLTGENIIAGAGNAVSVGLLMLIAFASISHRQAQRRSPARFHQSLSTQQFPRASMTAASFIDILKPTAGMV